MTMIPKMIDRIINAIHQFIHFFLGTSFPPSHPFSTAPTMRQPILHSFIQSSCIPFMVDHQSIVQISSLDPIIINALSNELVSRSTNCSSFHSFIQCAMMVITRRYTILSLFKNACQNIHSLFHNLLSKVFINPNCHQSFAVPSQH
jgi:hypothetical protein